jgi:hypothetical protein
MVNPAPTAPSSPVSARTRTCEPTCPGFPRHSHGVGMRNARAGRRINQLERQKSPAEGWRRHPAVRPNSSRIAFQGCRSPLCMSDCPAPRCTRRLSRTNGSGRPSRCRLRTSCRKDLACQSQGRIPELYIPRRRLSWQATRIGLDRKICPPSSLHRPRSSAPWAPHP